MRKQASQQAARFCALKGAPLYCSNHSRTQLVSSLDKHNVAAVVVVGVGVVVNVVAAAAIIG